MALSEVVGMGRHNCEHPSRILSGSYILQFYFSGEVAELAVARKCQKYADVPSAYTFLPIAMETLGSMNDSAYPFFEDLGRKISEVSGDRREGSFIFQRLSITIQRLNAVLFHKSFTLARRSGPLAIPHLLLIFFFVFNPWTYTTRGIKNITISLY